MGNHVSKLLDKLFGSKEMRLLMLGLDAAGKTSTPPALALTRLTVTAILYNLKLEQDVTTIPTVGFNVKGKKHGTHGRPGNSEVSGGASKKATPNGQGDETSASASEKHGGTPAGTSKAGGEEGNDQQGHATPITGQASQAVKIQPGYAPSRAAKGGKEHQKAGTEQGAGGKARTATVTGGTQVGDEFTYVPTAGGAVPGPSAGLQQNYTESLKWVAKLPW